ncbi:MAG: hypothetical protein E6J34_16405 [Chloroflexi bacterium]|nr:MAG: hypothetical protein E6J34_16405 [Chloroflexota bacterium]
MHQSGFLPYPKRQPSPCHSFVLPAIQIGPTAQPSRPPDASTPIVRSTAIFDHSQATARHTLPTRRITASSIAHLRLGIAHPQDKQSALCQVARLHCIACDLRCTTAGYARRRECTLGASPSPPIAKPPNLSDPPRASSTHDERAT